jgi:hypothetical protein
MLTVYLAPETTGTSYEASSFLSTRPGKGDPTVKPMGVTVVNVVVKMYDPVSAVTKAEFARML